jgi:hypothetical protein
MMMCRRGAVFSDCALVLWQAPHEELAAEVMTDVVTPIDMTTLAAFLAAGFSCGMCTYADGCLLNDGLCASAVSGDLREFTSRRKPQCC